MVAAPAAISALPSLDEWRNAREIPVAGSSSLGCETKMVREWLRVVCRWTKKIEWPESIRVLAGGVDGKTKIHAKDGDVMELITPIAPASHFEAELTWAKFIREDSNDTQKRVHTLLVDRASGVPEDQVTGSFKGFKTFPSRSAFLQSGKEITVTGSSTLGCSTRWLDGWLMLECGLSTGSQDSIFDVTSIVGAEESEMFSVATSKALLAILPFHEGSDLTLNLIDVAEKPKQLTLHWPSGQPMPSPAGSFEGASAMPSEEEFKAAPEVIVKGSSALHCSTKLVKGEWFRVVCAGRNENGGTPNGVFVGGDTTLRPEDVVAYERKGISSITAKLAAGNKLEALFFWTDTVHMLTVDWPKGKPLPQVVGVFEGARSPLDAPDAGK